MHADHIPWCLVLGRNWLVFAYIFQGYFAGNMSLTIAQILQTLDILWSNITRCWTQYERKTWWRHQMETFSALLDLCAGNSPVPVNSPHKGQRRGTLMFSLICARINDRVNNREAGDLRRHRGHYDVIVMNTLFRVWTHKRQSLPRPYGRAMGRPYGRTMEFFGEQIPRIVHDTSDATLKLMGNMDPLRIKHMVTTKQNNIYSYHPISNRFSWIKMYEFRMKLHWSLFLWIKLTLIQHWFR